MNRSVLIVFVILAASLGAVSASLGKASDGLSDAHRLPRMLHRPSHRAEGHGVTDDFKQFSRDVNQIEAVSVTITNLYWATTPNCTGKVTSNATWDDGTGTNFTLNVCLNITDASFNYFGTTGQVFIIRSISGNAYTESYFFNRQCTGTPDQVTTINLNTCINRVTLSLMLSLDNVNPVVPAAPSLNLTGLPKVDISTATVCPGSPSSANCTSPVIAYFYEPSDLTCSGPVNQTANLLPKVFHPNTCYNEVSVWGTPFTIACTYNGQVIMQWYQDTNCSASTLYQTTLYQLQPNSNTTVCQNMDNELFVGTYGYFTSVSNNFVYQCAFVEFPTPAPIAAPISPPTPPTAPIAPIATPTAPINAPTVPTTAPSASPTAPSAPVTAAPTVVPSTPTATPTAPTAPSKPSTPSQSSQLNPSIVLALSLLLIAALHL